MGISPVGYRYLVSVPQSQTKRTADRNVGDFIQQTACSIWVSPKFFEAGFVDMMMGKRSEEHTSELQSLMRISYAVLCLKKKHTILQRIYIIINFLITY